MSTISATDFGKKLSAGKAPHVVDVRTPAEFAACHVAGAKLAPLDALDPRKVADALKVDFDAEVYLLCKGGTRAGKAAEQFRAAGFANACVVEGGTDGCVAANVPVERGAKAGLPLDGQIRIALGSLVLLFWLLGRYVHPGFDYLVLFMAAGLIFSGISGFCGMAMLLGKAPWNQNKSADSCRVC